MKSSKRYTRFDEWILSDYLRRHCRAILSNYFAPSLFDSIPLLIEYYVAMNSESCMILDLPDACLRAIQEGDGPFMRALYASTRDDLRALPMPKAVVADLIAMQQQIHETGQRNAFPAARRWIVAWRGEAIGRIVVDMGDAEWRLIDIAILPAARRQGIGSAILRALQRGAATRGAAVALAVARSNDAARRLYVAAGFAVRGADELQEQMAWNAQH